MSYDECISKEASGELGGHTDCFIISGSKILEGVGSYVVIAVGTKSFNGRIMMGALCFTLTLFSFIVYTPDADS